jgi:hypothetical protein
MVRTNILQPERCRVAVPLRALLASVSWLAESERVRLLVAALVVVMPVLAWAASGLPVARAEPLARAANPEVAQQLPPGSTPLIPEPITPAPVGTAVPTVPVAPSAPTALPATAPGPTVPAPPRPPPDSSDAADVHDRSLLPEVRAGFDGLTKAGRWLTVRAVAANDGPPLDGEIRLATRPSASDAAVYTQAVELATRSRKLIQFQVPGPTGPGDLRLILASRGQDVASRSVPIRVLNPNDFLVGVLSDDGIVPSGLGSVRRGGNPVAVAMLTPADLPTDPRALQPLDALIVRQASSDRLTTDQRAALRTWIEQGGQLIVAGGPGWRRSIEGLDDLLPVEGIWTRQVKHLRSLSRYAGVGPPEGDVLVTLGSPIDGARVFLTQDSIPLIVERWLGLGRVTFVGPDPGIEPFRSWPAADTLWQRILVGGRPDLPALEQASLNDYSLRNVLTDLLDLGLPAPTWIATFLVGYVVVVGPGQYLVLRRMDRREWAWIGFPLVALVASGLVLIGAAWLRGPEIRLAAVSLMRVGEGVRSAPLDTFMGVVAPTRGSYDLVLADGQVPGVLGSQSAGVAGGPVTVATDAGGGPTRLPELRLEGRVVQGLELQTYVVAPTPIEAELKTTNGRLEGIVRNVGPDRLEDAIVVASGEALGLGDIAPGASKPISLSLPTTRSPGQSQNGPAPWNQSSGRDPPDGRRQLVAQLVQPPGRTSDGETTGGAVMYAWSAATPPRLMLGDQRVTGMARRLTIAALPIDFGDSHVTIPPGLLGRTVLDGAVLGQGGTSFVARGPIVFQYDLPPQVTVGRLDRLSVHLAYGTSAANSSPPPRVSLYRWADRTWVDVPFGSPGVVEMSFGGAFLDGGSIRARIEPQGSSATVNQLDLSLEGERQ